MKLLRQQARGWVAFSCIVLAASCIDRPVREESVVARAAGHVITAAELARMLADGRYLPLRADIVERWAWWWVEYTLFVERVAQGDSLLDSATVVASRWPDLRTAVVDEFYARLAAEEGVDRAAAVDSAFTAGDLRYLRHILVRTSEDMTEGERSVRRRRAEALRARLLAGEPWATVQQASDDETVKRVGGSLGIVARGQTLPAFERAAFALEPGALSAVTESPNGFHIIWRPELSQIRDVFARVIADTLYWRERDAYAATLPERHGIRLAAGAPDIVREAARFPNRAKQSRERIATYDGGVFTTAEFVRWLQVLPVEVHEGITQSSDAELRELAGRMIRYDLEWREAQGAGIAFSDSAFQASKRRLSRDLRDLRRALGIDAAWVERAREQPDASAEAVADYLLRFGEGPGDVDPELVPPFLADKLRAEARWSIRYDALDEVLALARALRAADSTESAGAPQE